jgi:hypothetical protein
MARPEAAFRLSANTDMAAVALTFIDKFVRHGCSIRRSIIPGVCCAGDKSKIASMVHKQR